MFHIFINKEMGSWLWSMTCSHTRQGAESFSAGLKWEFPTGQRGFLFMSPVRKVGESVDPGTRHSLGMQLRTLQVHQLTHSVNV